MTKTSKKILALFLSVLMLVTAIPLTVINASAADPTDPKNGGLYAYFSTIGEYDDSATPNVSYIDTSKAGTDDYPYFHIINKTGRTATISVNNTNLLNWNISNYNMTDNGRPYHERNRISPSKGIRNRSNGEVIDFSVTYTLEGVYDADGKTLKTFVAPVYIGVWNPSNNSKATSSFSFLSGGNYRIGITSQFQTDKGILEGTASVTGNNANNVTATVTGNYWIDTTGMASNLRTWQNLGFRMYMQHDVDARNHFQNSNWSDTAGTIRLTSPGNTFTNSPSLSMTDLRCTNVKDDNSVVDAGTGRWGGPYPNLTDPVGQNYVANSSNGYAGKRLWEPVSKTMYATLWDIGDFGWIPFVGTLFEQSKTNSTTKYSTITMDRMHWNSANSTGGYAQDAYVTANINCYVFDKTELINTMYNMVQKPLMSAYYEGSFNWTRYDNALRKAAEVLANQKTNQYDVTQAANDLQNAYNDLVASTPTKGYVNVTHTSNPKSGNQATVQRMVILSPGANVPYYDNYKNDTTNHNKYSQQVTATGNLSPTNAGFNPVTYTYWYIDMRDAQDTLDRAKVYIDKFDWCYTAEYRNDLQSAYNTLKDYVEHHYEPADQNTFDTALYTLQDLLNNEGTDSNHEHKWNEGVWENNGPTCTEGDNLVKTCNVCGKETKEYNAPLGHNFTGDYVPNDASDGAGTHYQKCVRYNDCSTMGTGSGENARENVAADCTSIPNPNTSNDEECEAATICEYCKQQLTASTNHDWDEGRVTSEANCAREGTKEYTCNNNPEHKKTEPYEDQTNHSWGTWTPDGNATCTDGGTESRSCRNECGIESQSRPGNPLGHDFTGEWVNWQDEEDGTWYHAHQCKRCDAKGMNDEETGEPHEGEKVACSGGEEVTSCGDVAICEVCGKSYGEEIPHNFKGGEVVSNENGTHSYKCANGCGAVGIYDEETDEQKVNGYEDCDGAEPTKCEERAVCSTCHEPYGDPKAHELTEVEAKDATCLADGNEAYWDCENCDKIFADDKGDKETTLEKVKKEQLKHDYTDTDNVKSNGDDTHSYKCKNGCGKYGFGEELNGKQACSGADPTECEERAVCTVCSQEFGKAKAHDFVDGKVVDNKDGTHSYECKNGCGEKGVGTTKDATEKCDYGKASCTEAATCSVCGHSTGTAIGHDFNGDVEFVKDGEHAYKCTRCDATGVPDGEEGDIEACDNEDATCTEDSKCSKCEHVYATATGHDFSGDAHDNEDGTHSFDCKNNCGETGVDKTEGANEKHIDVDGNGECDKCGALIGHEHQFTTGDVRKRYMNPTCTTTGLDAHYCTICWDEDGVLSFDLEHDTLIIPLVPHDKPDDYEVIPATSTEPEKHVYKCNVCGNEITEVVRGKEVHSYVWVATNDTCGEDGLKELKCQYCDDVIDFVKGPTREHHLVYIPAEPASCTNTGKTYGYFCDICDEIVKEPQTTEKTAHVDKNGDGICDDCQQEVTREDIKDNCLCHKTGFFYEKLLYPIAKLFWRLFGMNKTCACGAVHY